MGTTLTVAASPSSAPVAKAHALLHPASTLEFDRHVTLGRLTAVVETTRTTVVPLRATTTVAMMTAGVMTTVAAVGVMVAATITVAGATIIAEAGATIIAADRAALRLFLGPTRCSRRTSRVIYRISRLQKKKKKKKTLI